jgi:hypothetical protein
MDIQLTALTISFLSILLASLSLGWNIYRDVILKPRLRVRFQVSTVVHPALPSQTFLGLTAVNHGPGRITCNMIHVRTAPLWRSLLRAVKHGVVIGDWTNPLSGKLPKMLEVGETLTLLLPYEKRCFLSSDSTQIGILDSFGRSHWAPSHQVKEAREQYRKKFGEQSGTEDPVA